MTGVQTCASIFRGPGKGGGHWLSTLIVDSKDSDHPTETGWVNVGMFPYAVKYLSLKPADIRDSTLAPHLTPGMGQATAFHPPYTASLTPLLDPSAR